MSILDRLVFLSMFCCVLFDAARSAPTPDTKYDQRQEGKTNIRADLENFLIVVVPSGGIRLIDTQEVGNIISMFGNSRNRFANKDAASPPTSPYKVDIEQSAIDKLHADIDNMNAIIPASKSFIGSQPAEKKEESVAAEKENVVEGAVKNEDKKDEKETSEEQKTPLKMDSETTAAPVEGDVTTMEAIVTSVNSYNNKIVNEKEKIIDIAPASVTVYQTKKSGEPQIVEIEKPNVPTPSEEKRPETTPEPTSTPEASSTPKEPEVKPTASSESSDPTKITGVKVTQQVTTHKHQHHEQHQQTVKHQQVQSTKKTTTVVTHHEKNTKVTSPASSPVVILPPQASKTEVRAISPKSPKILVSDGNETRLEALQTGLMHCSPGQRLSYNGECVNINARQSRREDMERLLSALRFGVAPANRS